LTHRAGGRGGHLGVHLVGGDLDEGLVGLDRVALLLVPLQHGASETESPIAGMTTSIVVSTAICGGSH
jgi:hypothetical protein